MRREDEQQLRDLVYRYARMMDRLALDWLPEVFTEDGTLEWSGKVVKGYGPLRQLFQKLDRFDVVFHSVHNTYFEIDGDRASGEVYCVANHVHSIDQIPFKLDMGIRYEDEYVREEGQWLIRRRQFNHIWKTDVPMEFVPDGTPQGNTE